VPPEEAASCAPVFRLADLQHGQSEARIAIFILGLCRLRQATDPKQLASEPWPPHGSPVEISFLASEVSDRMKRSRTEGSSSTYGCGDHAMFDLHMEFDGGIAGLNHAWL